MKLWFVYKMYTYATPLKCMSEAYYNLNQGTFDMERVGWRIQEDTIVIQEAKAIPVSGRKSDRVRASFHLSIDGKLLGVGSDYDVMATDYDNYAIIENCIPSRNPGKRFQLLVLLTRKQLPERLIKRKMNRLLKKFGFSLAHLKKIDHGQGC